MPATLPPKADPRALALAVPGELRAKPVGGPLLPARGGDLPRALTAAQADARREAAFAIRIGAESFGVSNRELGDGDDRDGARLKSGNRAACIGRAILMFPLALVVALVAHLLALRLTREAAMADADLALRCRLGRTHVDALRALFCPEHS